MRPITLDVTKCYLVLEVDRCYHECLLVPIPVSSCLARVTRTFPYICPLLLSVTSVLCDKILGHKRLFHVSRYASIIPHAVNLQQFIIIII